MKPIRDIFLRKLRGGLTPAEMQAAAGAMTPEQAAAFLAAIGGGGGGGSVDAAALTAVVAGMTAEEYAAWLGAQGLFRNPDTGAIESSEAWYRSKGWDGMSATIAVGNQSLAWMPPMSGPAFANVTTLDCGSNQLTSLPATLPAGLTTLYCGSNQLTSLPATLPAGLTYLECGSNQLTSLPATLPAGLTYLNCYANQLTSLPATLPAGLTYLDCGSNQLTEAGVDGAISALLAKQSGNSNNGYVNLTGEFMSPPSSTGIANAATLAGDPYFWTVTYTQPA